ncbi:MAG TPA: DUF4190 domain-containing protein [Gemmataceae bacterium]|nr:DUF4190 domain-containing protein [Gemmataceae bacterium]
MAIIFTCYCGQSLQAPDQYAGGTARCPVCGRELPIPGQRPQKSGWAIAGLVLGIISAAAPWLPGIIAVVLGTLGLREIRQNHGRITGTAPAIAGIVLGGIAMVMLPLVLFVPAIASLYESLYFCFGMVVFLIFGGILCVLFPEIPIIFFLLGGGSHHDHDY